jgi:hypothetical protein
MEHVKRLLTPGVKDNTKITIYLPDTVYSGFILLQHYSTVGELIFTCGANEDYPGKMLSF